MLRRGVLRSPGLTKHFCGWKCANTQFSLGPTYRVQNMLAPPARFQQKSSYIVLGQKDIISSMVKSFNSINFQHHLIQGKLLTANMAMCIVFVFAEWRIFTSLTDFNLCALLKETTSKCHFQTNNWSALEHLKRRYVSDFILVWLRVRSVKLQSS